MQPVRAISRRINAEMFLLFQFKPHIMQIEMPSTTNSRLQVLTRWSVVIARTGRHGGLDVCRAAGLMGKLDAIGYAVCHRLESHSLKIGELQMPLCARCTGEFNAAAVALIFQALVSPRQSKLPSRGVLAVLSGLFLAFAFDGSNSYMALMKSMDPGTLAPFRACTLPTMSREF